LTGAHIWDQVIFLSDCGCDYDGPPVVANSVLYITASYFVPEGGESFGWSEFTLDATTGALLWTYKNSASDFYAVEAPVVANGVVYVHAHFGLYTFHLPGASS
jgi:outer membrane protein assembly factor BamB